MSSPIAIDRLSLLPDELLHHVLSFLPDSYEAARTAVLSSRFRRIWAHHPSIRLLLSGDFGHLPSNASSLRHRSHVGRCLSSHNLVLLLSLDLSLVSSRSAHRWIHLVSTRSPFLSSLRISSLYRYRITFPRPVFACRNLVSLEMKNISFPSVPSSFPGFLSLTNLNLLCCQIEDQTLTSLLTKCPNLTTLSLHNITTLTSLHISSTKLTHLNITQCYLHMFRINAPNLTSITYNGNLNTLYLENAAQLLHADISHFCPWKEESIFATQSEWARLIMDLPHVLKELRVNHWLFLYMLPDSIPEPLFMNLKVLHCCVQRITSTMLDGLMSILGHCSNLEQLRVDMTQYRYPPYSSRTLWLEEMEDELEEDKERQVWDPQNFLKDRQDLAQNLKTVTVNCFIGTPNEMKMLEYLLGRVSILKKLIIRDCMFRTLKEIRLLFTGVPRASSHLQTCQLKMTH